MQHLHLRDLTQWDRIRRANFVNSLSGFKSASLIGSIDVKGHHNLSLISNIVHLGADPALIGYINRPRAATPHTLGNIEATGVYTVNHIHPGPGSSTRRSASRSAPHVGRLRRRTLRSHPTTSYASSRSQLSSCSGC